MNVVDVLPRDAIPSVDDPEFASTYGGAPDDEVIAVTVDGEARAYPLRILHYHEIVNDVVGGEPVAITWCPLCGSAVVYGPTVDGQHLTFGVSGKLADEDLVMYDRETESEWKQSTGEAIAGPLSGTTLTVLPATMTTWAQFREAYPAGVVLQPPNEPSEVASDDDEPAPVEYDDSPYREYFESDGIGLAAHRGTGTGREWDRDDIDPKAVVVGIEAGGEVLGVPANAIEQPGLVRVSVGGLEVVVFRTTDGLHASEDPGYAFEPRGGSAFGADGTTWDVVTGESDDGRRLDRLPVRRLFAFTWQDDHGPDAFYDVSAGDGDAFP